ncbi:MAG: YceI family protein [Gillisia sp.]
MKNIKWSIDPAQSEITFKVRKLLITTVKGNFKSFKGELETETENFSNLKNLKFEAKVASIKTDDEKRDEHLKSADFFNKDEYPYFSFKANNFKIKETKLEGELTIRNITKPVTLDVEFLGISRLANQETSAGLLISGKVNRQDFGLSWNGKNEAGEIIVGDEIKLEAKASFIQLPALVEEF